MPRIIVEETVQATEENNSSAQPPVQTPQAGQVVDGVQPATPAQPAVASQEPAVPVEQATTPAEVQPVDSQPATPSALPAQQALQATAQSSDTVEQAPPVVEDASHSSAQGNVSQPAVASASTESSKPASKRSKKPFYIAGTAIVVLAVTIGGVLFFGGNSSDSEVQGAATVSQQQTSESEAIQLKNKLSQFMLLPSEEVPTVATVVDVEKVKNQAFFTNAQNGDKVLLFAESGKAILYRPSSSIIVEVAPINLGDK